MDQFNFGENQANSTIPMVPNQRGQISYPLDSESLGTLRLALENVLKDIIVRHNRILLTVPSGATSFVIVSNYTVLTGAAAVTIATIGGGKEGMELVLEFADANITITDNATGGADTVNLSAAFTSTTNDVLRLLYNGTSWREISRSVN